MRRKKFKRQTTRSEKRSNNEQNGKDLEEWRRLHITRFRRCCMFVETRKRMKARRPKKGGRKQIKRNETYEKVSKQRKEVEERQDADKEERKNRKGSKYGKEMYHRYMAGRTEGRRRG